MVDDAPLLFHTGPRKLFPLVREAIAAVMPVERLRWISFSHVEADECGSSERILGRGAQRGAPLRNDCRDGFGRTISPTVQLARCAEGETVSLGKKSVTWIDAPHVPHGWECGFLFEQSTRTLFSGDLFTQGGAEHPPITDSDILGPSEAFRQAMDYYSHTKSVRGPIEQLAALAPTTLACMHGSAWRGDGARLLRELGDVLAR